MADTLVLDHVNIRTARLAEMTAWYCEALGMVEGWRPALPFPGAWLYCGEAAVAHLIAVEAEPGCDPGDLKIEHFALRGTDLQAFLDRMARMGVATRLGRPPGAGVVQVNVVDPDGNHIHVDFPDPGPGPGAPNA